MQMTMPLHGLEYPEVSNSEVQHIIGHYRHTLATTLEECSQVAAYTKQTVQTQLILPNNTRFRINFGDHWIVDVHIHIL